MDNLDLIKDIENIKTKLSNINKIIEDENKDCVECSKALEERILELEDNVDELKVELVDVKEQLKKLRQNYYDLMLITKPMEEYFKTKVARERYNRKYYESTKEKTAKAQSSETNRGLKKLENS